MGFFKKKIEDVEEEIEEQDDEPLQLTRAEVLQRLREVWQELAPERGALTPAGKEFVENNIALVQTWVRVVESTQVVAECEGAIGFHYEDENDEGYGEGDFPDEDEQIICKEGKKE